MKVPFDNSALGQMNPLPAIRHTLVVEDIEKIARLHQSIYSREYGFDSSFEYYVLDPLRVFFETQSARDRVWIAESQQKVIGCIAIVGVSIKEAQLRWFLVAPEARGSGLGSHLLRDAVQFCRECHYERVFLWTVRALGAAARLYHAAGFAKVEEKPGRQWGVDVIEEKYLMDIH